MIIYIMGASGAVSKSDVESLKSAVKTLQSKMKALETTTVDDKAIQGVVKNLDYLKLKNELNMGDLSTEVLKSPGALADALAQSFNKDAGRMVPIATALADNETFAKTLADTLVDTSGKYRSALRGDKGETGDISTSKDAVKAALYDKKYTMWCADGDYCVLPVGSKGIKIGNWYLEPHRNGDGNLHFHKGNVDDWFLSVENGKSLAVRTNIYAHEGSIGARDNIEGQNVKARWDLRGQNLHVPGDSYIDNVKGGNTVKTNHVYGIGSVERGGWLSNQGNAIFKGGDKAGWEKVRFEQY